MKSKRKRSASSVGIVRKGAMPDKKEDRFNPYMLTANSNIANTDWWSRVVLN
jgi:hypothetical protein